MSEQVVSQVWRHHYYQSGTQVVTTDEPDQPWLYVFGPVGDEDARYQMCEELTTWLNGGNRPVWMDDMKRKSEEELHDVDGSSITATGPMYDADPPKCHWKQRMDDEAVNARARLIDRLWFARNQSGVIVTDNDGEID